MNNLNTLQTDFVASIFDVCQKSVVPIITETKLSAAERLAIYRNNTFSNLRGALQAIYPVIHKLVGDDFFHHTANEFIRAAPSVSGDLHDYGEPFADFLRDFEPAKNLAYLPDVAKLEWACQRVFHAADHAGLDVQKLDAIAPEQYGELRFDLHPATVLLTSPYPTLKIWQVNQDDYVGDQTVNLNQGGNHLLVSRETNFATLVEALSAANFTFLLALHEKNNLNSAAEKALTADEGFDLGASLRRFVAQKILVDFNL